MGRTSTAETGPSTRELVSLVMREIGGAAYSVGSLAPPEAVLQRRFGATRYRLREAMDVIRKMGVVDSRPGIGTIILSKTPNPIFVQSQQTLESIEETARSTQLRVQSVATCTLGRKAASELGLAAGSRWCCIETLRYLRHSAAPIGALRLYLPPKFAPVSAQIDHWLGPVFKLIEREYGTKATLLEQEIDSCTLDADLARRLIVPPASAALKVTRRWYDRSGATIQVSVGLYPQGKSRYRSRLVLSPSATEGARNGE